MPDTSDIPEPLPFPKRISIPALDREESFPCRYNDCDINGHVNNTRYASWFCDLLEPEYHAHHVLSDLQINYNQEIMPGTELAMTYNRQEDTVICEGREGDTTFFQAQGIYKEI
jgi:acyl-ACP thioesterase